MSAEQANETVEALDAEHSASLAAISATTMLFLEVVRRDQICMSADERVGEKDAARLIGYSPGHLKHLRQEGKGPVFYRRGLGGSRYSYRLSLLAAWIEGGQGDQFGI